MSIIIVAFFALSHVSAGGASDEAGCQFVFESVNVIPISVDELLTDQTVLIDCGVISAIGPSDDVVVPNSYSRIDATGQFLMPGLSDMHAHVRISAESIASGMHPELILYLLNGVTTIRDMAGSELSLSLRDSLESNELVGPRLYASSPLLEGENAVWDFSEIVKDEDAARRAVTEYADAGYDFIKVYHTLSADAYLGVLAESNKRGLKVVGHVPFDVGIEGALEFGQYSISHLRGYDIDGVERSVLEIDGGRNPERFASWLYMSDERMLELVKATVRSGAWNAPTIVVNDLLVDAEELPELVNHPMSRHMPDHLLASLADPGLLAVFSRESIEMLRQARPAQLKFLKLLFSNGGRVLVGTDTFPSLIPGYTVIDEIEAFVEAGLTPYQALRSATFNAADHVGAADSFGTLEVGQDADLILLSNNPLADVRALWQLSGTMTGGEWYPRDVLFSLLHEANENLKSLNE